MSYLYPPYPVVPTIPATLPPNPLAIIGASANFTLDSSMDIVICFGGNYGIFLPLSNTMKAKPYYIKLWGNGPISINVTSPDTIDGLTIGWIRQPYESRILMPWQGANWMSI